MVNSQKRAPKTKGQFVVGFVTAIEEISAAFEAKVRNILAENGIEDLKPDEHYPVEAVAQSINQMAEDVGPKTIHKIGIFQVTIPDWPDDIDTVEAGFEAINDMYSGAYINYREEDLGRFRFEKTDERQGRASVTSEFPYHPAFASGIFEGIIQDLGPEPAFPRLSETEPRSDEKAAYELQW